MTTCGSRGCGLLLCTCCLTYLYVYGRPLHCVPVLQDEARDVLKKQNLSYALYMHRVIGAGAGEEHTRRLKAKERKAREREAAAAAKAGSEAPDAASGAAEAAPASQ